MKALFFIILSFGVLAANGQQNGVTANKTASKSPSNASHLISINLGNLLYFSLENNDNTNVSAQKQLVINSNIAFNVVVTENYSENVSFGFMPVGQLIEEASGPAVSHLTSVKRIKYFRDSDKVRFLTALLYTAAPL